MNQSKEGVGMTEILTGKDICSQYNDIRNDAFGTEDHHYVFMRIPKERLYNVPCPQSRNGKNLMTYKEWESHPENYDDFHTKRIDGMIVHLRRGGTFPPLIVDRSFSLYDGQHRLTAYSMQADSKTIEIYKEV